MKLCDAMRQIYKDEIARGNKVMLVTNHERTSKYPASLVVYMESRLGDYDLPYVKLDVFLSLWSPRERYYICNECGCIVSGPVENGQRDRYWNIRKLPPDPQVIATPENVYWTDDDRYDEGIPPTVLESAEDPFAN